jgi:hypothetical protein
MCRATGLGSTPSIMTENMARIVFVNARDMADAMSACPEWRRVGIHYEDAHPIHDYRVILAARPHEAVHLKDLATLLGACQIKDPRILLVTGELGRADELAFVVSDGEGGLGLIVCSKVEQGDG